jgi:AAA domain, putative AbiEii toxin, Type IV TA system
MGCIMRASTLADHRLGRTIDNDVTVAKNFQLLYAQGLEAAFEKLAPDTTMGQFRDPMIGRIRSQLARVLPGLHLDSLGNPFKTQSFRFSKGTVRGFNYMNLSGGEKAAFDLILDYIVKKAEFDDTVFCIDEPEAHLNPRVHSEMLSCLFDLTDDKSQLWLGTHSIGMLRRARDLYEQYPERVAFLDFEKDFDQKQTVTPIIPDRVFWQRSLSVALDDLAELVSPREIIVCESGKRGAAPGEGFDAEIYNRIFGSELPETHFVSIGSSSDMKGDRFLVVQAMANLIQGVKVLRLIDRDGRSDVEIADLENQGYRVLRQRHLEAYLFDDEVLKALCDAVGKPDQEPQLLGKSGSDRGCRKERS